MLSVLFLHGVRVGSRPGSVEGGMFLGRRPIDDFDGEERPSRGPSTARRTREGGTGLLKKEEGAGSKVEQKNRRRKFLGKLGVVKATASRWGLVPGFSSEA